MKFALLGSDDATLRLVQAIAADSAHEVVAVYGAEQHQRTLFDLAPGASFGHQYSQYVRICFTAAPLEEVMAGIEVLQSVIDEY